jgi:hypothetical protein
MFRIVFWDVLPCKMIVDRRFRGAYCLNHQAWMSAFTLAYYAKEFIYFSRTFTFKIFSSNTLLALCLETLNFIERRSRMVITPASYSGGSILCSRAA